MTIIDILYNIIIFPIELIIETVYSFLNTLVKTNHGFSIIGLSIFVSLLCLPLYLKADRIQENERLIQKKLSGKISSIQKHFSGNEKYMILSMYYRINHYHPIMALRSSLSLLIQIPFFIAAYHFLSHFEPLKNSSFLIIKDLSLSDKLLSFNSFSINLLPIIMTVINVITGIIYSKGFPFKDRLQLYLMAAIFLVLLYNAPAALTLYWTCNNIFSLFKNIFIKFKHPLRILYILILASCLILCIYIFNFRPNTQGHSKKLFIMILFAFASLPVFLYIIKTIGKKYFSHLKLYEKEIKKMFILVSIAIFVLCSLYIPFNMIASDPFEFIQITSNESIFSILLIPVIIGLGIFIFWPVYLYNLSSVKIKIFWAFFYLLLLLSGIINLLLFSGNYGMITKTLTFQIGTEFSVNKLFWISSIFLSMLVFALILFIFKRKYFLILSSIVTILIITIILACFPKINDIYKGQISYQNIKKNNPNTNTSIGGEGDNTQELIQPVINLSRTGKNVIVIMLDRAISAYLPLIFNDLDYLKQKFSGFTYYPNTVSYFGSTILGIPPLLGGYEYTPEKLHERNNMLMIDKHNEAAMVMPEIFRQNNYSVSVFDIPYINYQNVMDTSFYTEKDISAFNLSGKYDEIFINELGDNAPITMNPIITLKRNFIMFSIFKIASPIFRKYIYRNGSYWNASENNLYDIIETINYYSILHYLPQMTNIEETGNNFMIMVNQLTHKASFLQYPEYKITKNITDYGPDYFNGDKYSFQNYHTLAAAFILLSNWFEELHKMNVYNNTRIIIVADHDAGCVRPMLSNELNTILSGYNPLLLFKDFYSTGEIMTDMSFMTNADTPLLAVHNLFPNVLNPFTGNELSADKENGVSIYLGGSSQPSGFPGWEALNKTSNFYYVTDNIFDLNNWIKIEKQY